MTEVEAKHFALLERWRGSMNLVGPGPIEPHFIDSRGAVRGLEASGSWADLGSGAGFPGIALAENHPEATVILVESRSKRAAFLKRVLSETGLANAEVFHGRTEDLAPGLDGVIGRAYRPPGLLLEDADRLLLPDGVAVILSGEPLPAQAAWQVVRADRYPVPGGDRVRTILKRA
jgi:16S rRNA (guanine527-N7)-methyltransferase